MHDFNFSYSYISDYVGSLLYSGRNLPPLSSEATLKMKEMSTAKLFSFLLDILIHCTAPKDTVIFIFCAHKTHKTVCKKIVHIDNPSPHQISYNYLNS